MGLLETPVEVWSATKIAATVDEAAAVVTVITRAQIDTWGYRTVAEVLQHLSGFYLIDDHVLPNLGVRGVTGGLWGESGIIKVLIDGHSVAFRSTGGNWLGPELLPMSALDRIEIVKGPASALYGADAFMGVINLVTRSARDIDGADISAGVGATSYGRANYDVEAAAGTAYDKVNFIAAFRSVRNDLSGLPIPSSSPAPNLPLAPRSGFATNLLQYSQVGFFRLGIETEKYRLTAYAYFSTIDRGGEFTPWLQLANGLDTDSRPAINRISLAQGHFAINAARVISDRLELTLDAQVFAGSPLSTDQLDVGSDLYSIKREIGFRGLDATLEARWKPHPRVTTVAGVGLLYDDEQPLSVLRLLKEPAGGLNAGDVIEAASTRQERTSIVNPSIYAQALWKPHERYLKLTAGVRYDWHNIYGNQVSARVGVVSTPLSSLTVKLLYGNAFKAPSPFFLYAVPLLPGDVIGNRALRPQHIHTFELQAIFKPHKSLNLTSGIAYNLLLDKTELSLQGTNQVARNVGRMDTVSWETGLQFSLDWLETYGNFELTHGSRSIDTRGYEAELLGSANTLYPSYQAHAGAALKPKKLASQFALEATVVGPRRASDVNILEAGAPYYLPPYLRLDARLSTRAVTLFPGRATELSLTLRNLLNQIPADPGFSGVDYPLAPRTVMATLTQEF